MVRKNPFANLMDEKPADNGVALDYTIKGASRSIISSIDELAEQADRLLEGETMVELDPELVDASFVRDRLEEDPQEFADLLAAIRRGQDTPILVRPHPQKSGRYMVVFGHRRLEIARQLGRKVRAVVKSLETRYFRLETTCLRWVSRGRTISEIASLEGKSVADIEHCLQSALVALQAKSIAEALQKAKLHAPD